MYFLIRETLEPCAAEDILSSAPYVAVLTTEQWKNGSFTGLTARGGFAVSAKWMDGRVIRMEIVSAVGGQLRLLVNGRWMECATEKGRQLVFVENENGFSVI